MPYGPKVAKWGKITRYENKAFFVVDHLYFVW